MTDTCGCCSEELGATEMRDLLLESVRNLTADLQRYQGLLKEAQSRGNDWLEAVELMKPVYEAAVEWHCARVPGMQQVDRYVGTEDALWDAIDTATTKRGSHGG